MRDELAALVKATVIVSALAAFVVGAACVCGAFGAFVARVMGV